MGLLKYVLVAVLAASAAFGVTATRGEASHRVDARLVVVQPGVLVQVPGIDLSCSVYRHDPHHTKSGHSCTATEQAPPGRLEDRRKHVALLSRQAAASSGYFELRAVPSSELGSPKFE
jgi:hypothetical protein